MLLPILVDRELSAKTREFARWYAGIDLGTTNSTAVVIDRDAVLAGDATRALRVIPVRQETENGVLESPLLASCVAELEPGRWIVGAGAKEARRRGFQRGRQIFYSTKSEMGIGREPFYPFASSPEVNCPYKVAGKILDVLRDAIASEAGEDTFNNLVVTIPASFQIGARRDTIRAAQLAGLRIADSALFDEPNAAFLDYILTVGTSSQEAQFDFSAPKVVLVFDFGGGTCDVSVLRVHHDRRSQQLSISNLAISRYERLGGDNIDAAIAENILLPELLRQNDLDPLELSWTEKKHYVLPQLLGVAEALKLGVCDEYRVQLGLRDIGRIDRGGIVATQPSQRIEILSRDKVRSLFLENPRLTLDEFEQVLRPFLDKDLLYERGSEYNPINSIHAPVSNVLDRAGLQKVDVDAVLLAGGCSLIPQIELSLSEFFERSVILKFPNVDHTLYAVGRGAALHSLWLHGFGTPLLKPIAQETIGVLALHGAFEPLIPAGTQLPDPADGSFRLHRRLRVPRDFMDEIQIVLAADNEKKVLAVGHIRSNELVAAGEEIQLRWRLDANKILGLEASLVAHPNAKCEITLENPLCSTGFESEDQRKILELEQEISEAVARGQALSSVLFAVEGLADLYYRQKKYERAIDWARKAIQVRGTPDVWMLNLMGNAYEKLGSNERSERIYREAIAAEPGASAPHFNLTLLLSRQDRNSEALASVEEAIRLQPEQGAYLAEKASLLAKVGRSSESQTSYCLAAKLLDQSGLESDFELSWRIFVANQLGEDASMIEELEERKRRGARPGIQYDKTKLPGIDSLPVRRNPS